VSTNTLKNWSSQGKIGYVQADPRRLYSLDDIKNHFKFKETDTRKTVLYCRVSSSKQKEDLERQKKYLEKAYPGQEVIQDIGSGLNWERRGFKRLVDEVLEGRVKTIVVTYKDRLCRFGFELVQQICSKNKANIVVLCKNNEISEGEELEQDLLSIITFFTARFHGKRSYSKEKRQVKERSTQ